MRLEQETSADGLHIWLLPENQADELMLVNIIDKGKMFQRRLGVVEGQYQGGIFLAHAANPAKHANKSASEAAREKLRRENIPLEKEVA